MYIKLRDGTQLTITYDMEIEAGTRSYYIKDRMTKKLLYEVPSTSVLYIRYE